LNLRQRLADEHGMALIMSVGMLLVLSITVIATLEFSASSSRSASFDRADQRAFGLAEAGLNDAISRLAQSPSTFTGTAVTTTYPGGTVTSSGTLSGGVWTLTATSSANNPTGGAALTRTVQRSFTVSSGGIPITGNEAYNYVFTNASGCTLLQNSFTITSPVYVTNNLCLKNSAQYRGSQLMVRGTVETDNSASVGILTDPVEDVRIGGGCRYTSSGPFLLPPLGCGIVHRVYPGTFTSTVPTYSKPPIDLDNAYATSKPGPNYPCTTGSLPSGMAFDNGGGRNSSAPKFELFASSNYDCQRWEGGQLVGQIKWTDGSPGTLVVTGTIFFDGEIEVAKQKDAVYTGTGTIYANKKILIQNHTNLCAVSGCATSWNPNDHMLTLVAGASDVPAFEIQNNTKFQGAVYTVGGFKIQNSAQMQGPIIASDVDVQNSAILTDWTDLTSLPVGVPASGTAAPTVTPVAGGWRG
jgi:Tfp pilus assembly protein PilX